MWFWVYMNNSILFQVIMDFLKDDYKVNPTIKLRTIPARLNLHNSKSKNNSNLKSSKYAGITMAFLLIASIISILTPYQSNLVFASTSLQEATKLSAEKSNSNESVSSSQSAKQTDPFPDTNTCQPGQIEGPFGNCTDPVCEPGQILSAHTCVNPSCPPGMEYNEDVGECLSDDFPPDATCPDGSQGIIRYGPNGITFIECPLPNPNTNPEPKPGIDRGDINIEDSVLENPNTNPEPKPDIDRGQVGNNPGVLKE